MNDPLEKDIERKVCEHARVHGILAYKFNSEGRRSVPDRMFITEHGHIFFIEFKRKGKKPTEAQQREINRIRDTGVNVYVVDNIDDGKRIIGLKAIGVNLGEIT